MPDRGGETIGQQYARAVHSWQASQAEFEEAILAQAQATADYKQARGRLIVKLKFDEPKMSQLVLEAHADADDAVAALLHTRLVADATVDSLKQRLAWHRAQADNLRTQVVDEREHNRLASSAGAGPGRSQVDPWSGGSRSLDPAQQRRALPPPRDEDAPPVRDWDR